MQLMIGFIGLIAIAACNGDLRMVSFNSDRRIARCNGDPRVREEGVRCLSSSLLGPFDPDKADDLGDS